jgi:hypothetical protein
VQNFLKGRDKSIGIMRRWENDIKMDLEEIWSVWPNINFTQNVKRVVGLCEENNENFSSTYSKDYLK